MLQVMGIVDNKRRGLDIEQWEFVKAWLKGQLGDIKETTTVKRHENHNDPYDFVIYEKKGNRTYKKYIEIKSGNAQLSPREKEFQKEHPRSYEIIRCSADSDFHKFKDEVRSLFSAKEWIKWLKSDL